MSIEKLKLKEVIWFIPKFFRETLVEKVNEIIDSSNDFPIERINFDVVSADQQTSVFHPVTADGHVGMILTQAFSVLPGENVSFQINNVHVNNVSHIFFNVVAFSSTYGTNGIPYITGSAGAGVIEVFIHNIHSANTMTGNLRFNFLVINNDNA